MDQLLKDCLESVKGEIKGDLSSCGAAPLSILNKCLTSVQLSLNPQPTSSTSTFNPIPLDQIQSQLSSLITLANEKFYTFPYQDVPLYWRRFYTDVVIIKSCCYLLLQSEEEVGQKLGEKKREVEDDFKELDRVYLRLIKELDLALIITGAPGFERKEIIYVLIEGLQSKLPSSGSEDFSRKRFKSNLSESTFQDQTEEIKVSSREDESSSRNDYPERESKLQESRSSSLIPILSTPPSLLKFKKTFSQSPFIVRGFANHWPALETTSQSKLSKWASISYLTSSKISGKGRYVPVEIGSSYTDSSWKQEIIGWKGFLDRIGWDDEKSNASEESQGKGEITYLAQHTLLTQFPNLLKDIILPDYIYSCPDGMDLENGEQYKPPNDDETIISVWIGPKGTFSPAHTDPYFNCYVQVVGHKQIWMAPPSSNKRGAMSTFGSTSSNTNDDEEEEPGASNYMSNTSRIDIFGKRSPSSPHKNSQDWISKEQIFKEDVEQHALTEILNPGDLLFFPPGWWHGMRSLEKVSILEAFPSRCGSS